MTSPAGSPALPDGIIAVVRSTCPTCDLVVPVLHALSEAGCDIHVLVQDDPGFVSPLPAQLDRDLSLSYHAGIDSVPTLLRIMDGVEQDRCVGWDRASWESFTGIPGLGPGLPDYQPGCGSQHLEPRFLTELEDRFGAARLRARGVVTPEELDVTEFLFDQGWSDGLPLVPPSPSRVLRMLEGCSREPDEVLGELPPAWHPCTVEKVAINAVMAGCRPEYLPVVIAAVEAACDPAFNLHGVLCTLMAVGPAVIVNGPIGRAIGMNSGMNALGQGNRANLTIGRALQLTIRNVGGGRPGGTDRACLGTPAKLSFCFAEDEETATWEPISVARGLPTGVSAVTLVAVEGPHTIADPHSRTAASLARSFAAALRNVVHPKHVLCWDALLIVSPEHRRLFAAEGWSRTDLERELERLLLLPTDEVLRDPDGWQEGMPRASGPGPAPVWHPDLPLFAPLSAGQQVPKFRPGGVLIVQAGGAAGPLSMVASGWVNGTIGNRPVTREIIG